MDPEPREIPKVGTRLLSRKIAWRRASKGKSKQVFYLAKGYFFLSSADHIQRYTINLIKKDPDHEVQYYGVLLQTFLMLEGAYNIESSYATLPNTNTIPGFSNTSLATPFK